MLETRQDFQCLTLDAITLKDRQHSWQPTDLGLKRTILTIRLPSVAKYVICSNEVNNLDFLPVLPPGYIHQKRFAEYTAKKLPRAPSSDIYKAANDVSVTNKDCFARNMMNQAHLRPLPKSDSMNWRTIIYVILLVSLTVVKALPRSYRDIEEKNSIGQRFSQLQENNFKAIAMIMFAQYVQGGTFVKAVEMAEDVTDLAKRCAAAARDNPDCLKPLDRIFLDTICQDKNLPRFTDCCAKMDPERNDCFLSLKNSSRGFISPFERPNAEAACKNHSQHQHPLTGYFIYEVSRRHPFLYAPTILSVAIRYDEMMKNCCGSAEHPTHNLEECFRRQAPKVVKPLKEDGLRQEHTCGILKKFGERTLKALKLAQISQKFPKADFVTVNKLVMDIANMHKDCCRGDMLDCMHDREEILQYVCTNQDTLSSKIKTCCEKPLLQRSECIVNAENDDKPADLSPHVREFIEDKGICERFAQEKDTHLARFLYEYSRRHPEFSAQMLLRIGKGYEDLLKECCKTGAPDNCRSRGEEELKKHIYETESVMKTSCDIYKEKGDYYFQNELLMSFTKKMPQLTSAELIKFTKQMTTIGSKCCQLSQDKLLPCAEENLDLVLGEICRRHLTDPINPGVCHCCSSSYALRRPCMGKLEIDENYVPLTLTPGLFTFHEDLCTTEEEKLQHKKQEMLINLIKYKPQITQEQLTAVTAAFTAMREQCCKEENRETCFVKEGPELIKRSEKMLSA